MTLVTLDDGRVGDGVGTSTRFRRDCITGAKALNTRLP